MTGAALSERLSRRVLLLDGGMGTLLQAVGLPPGRPSSLWSIERPEEVRRAHDAWIEAGADILFTNTFRANRRCLEPYGWGDRVAELNRAAVLQARMAARGIAFVAGDLGPCGPAAGAVRRLSRAAAVFAEQAEALASAGVDLLAIETMSDLEEMEVAVSAAKAAAPDLPILASFTFTRDGRLWSGESPSAAARVLEAMGVDIAGANCSCGFQSVLKVCEEMAGATTLPLAMKPNAGILPASPPSADEAADYARRFVEVGANMVGGCCGVDPSMLRGIAGAVKGMAPVRRPSVAASLSDG